MIVYVDIDDTICYYVDGNKCDYNLALPYPNKIRIINDLYDNGHTIVYWTARGTVSGLDFTEITKTQLQEWGCKYNKLMLGKPNYDLFIDDKTLTSIEQLNLALNMARPMNQL